jgi:hypothetical protein
MNYTKYALFIAVLTTSFINAQDNKTTITQDFKFEKLLNEKRKINTSLGVNENYQIQIYNGDSENAKKTLNSFKKDFRKYDGTIVFYTPSYKVLVGNFKTRIEVEKNLIDIKKTYKTAVIIKPVK